ncbi:MAG: hypothetical protein IT161_24545, partial [Bryobacterales bacterium]|nr:hypothetical protein [Bryobacterales bacterium]
MVVVEFLSTQCPACQECARLINRLVPEYSPKGVQFAGVANKPGAESLVQELARSNVWPPAGKTSLSAGRGKLAAPVAHGAASVSNRPRRFTSSLLGQAAPCLRPAAPR